MTTPFDQYLNDTVAENALPSEDEQCSRTAEALADVLEDDAMDGCFSNPPLS